MSVTPEQIQWAAYYCNLQTQGQQLSPEQAQWAFWYRQNYPPQPQQYSPVPFASPSPSSGYGVPVAASTTVTAATIKTNPGFLRLNMQQKGLVLKFVEALPELNKTFQEITGNPNFKFTFDVTNFGHPHHPKVEEYHRTSGYSFGPDKFTKEVPEKLQANLLWYLGFIADLKNTNLWAPLLSGWRMTYSKDLYKETLNGFLNEFEFRHAEANDNTVTHFEVLGGKLSYVWNFHSSWGLCSGRRPYPSSVAGAWVEVLEKVANIGSAPTTPVKFNMDAGELKEF